MKRVSRFLVTRMSCCAGLITPKDRENRLPSARIITYHSIQPGANNDFSVSVRGFWDQIAYLSDHYPVVSLGRIADWLEGKTGIEQTSVAVTLDDGFLDNFEHALPILRRYRIPCTVFLIQDLLTRRCTWMGKPVLGKKEIHAMAGEGVEFGSHSRSHLSLASASLSAEQLEREVRGSKTVLETFLGIPISYFSYPYGTARDVDDRVVEAVRRAGYRLGCTSIHGKNIASTNPLLLKRTKVERYDSLATFNHLLRGGLDVWALVDRHASFLQSKRRTSSATY